MKFTGHQRDLANLGGDGDDLDYMHARHYNPTLGRFLSVDRHRGGGRIPQSWNRYAYVGGRPLVFADPDGQHWGYVLLANAALDLAIDLVPNPQVKGALMVVAGTGKIVAGAFTFGVTAEIPPAWPAALTGVLVGTRGAMQVIKGADLMSRSRYLGPLSPVVNGPLAKYYTFELTVVSAEGQESRTLYVTTIVDGGPILDSQGNSALHRFAAGGGTILLDGVDVTSAFLVY